jgi:hypothetical protein
MLSPRLIRKQLVPWRRISGPWRLTRDVQAISCEV